jgi:hypothetical protein
MDAGLSIMLDFTKTNMWHRTMSTYRTNSVVYGMEQSKEDKTYAKVPKEFSFANGLKKMSSEFKYPKTISSLYDLTKLYTAVNLGRSHWIGIVIDFSTFDILWYDSFRDGDACGTEIETAVLDKFQLWLEEERNRHRSTRSLPKPTWKIRFPNCPQQPNCYDCGLCTLLFLQADWKGQELTKFSFGKTQEEVGNFLNEKRGELFSAILTRGAKVRGLIEE